MKRDRHWRLSITKSSIRIAGGITAIVCWMASDVSTATAFIALAIILSEFFGIFEEGQG